MSIMVMLCGMVMLPARWQNSIRNDVAMELAFHNALLSAHVPAAELRRQLAAVERATQAHDQVLVAHLGHLGVVPVDRPAICFGSFSCAALARPGEGGGGGWGGRQRSVAPQALQGRHSKHAVAECACAFGCLGCRPGGPLRVPVIVICVT